MSPACCRFDGVVNRIESGVAYATLRTNGETLASRFRAADLARYGIGERQRFTLWTMRGEMVAIEAVTPNPSK